MKVLFTVCQQMASWGYGHPTWRNIFRRAARVSHVLLLLCRPCLVSCYVTRINSHVYTSRPWAVSVHVRITRCLQLVWPRRCAARRPGGFRPRISPWAGEGALGCPEGETGRLEPRRPALVAARARYVGVQGSAGFRLLLGNRVVYSSEVPASRRRRGRRRFGCRRSICVTTARRVAHFPEIYKQLPWSQ